MKMTSASIYLDPFYDQIKVEEDARSRKNQDQQMYHYYARKSQLVPSHNSSINKAAGEKFVPISQNDSRLLRIEHLAEVNAHNLKSLAVLEKRIRDQDLVFRKLTKILAACFAAVAILFLILIVFQSTQHDVSGPITFHTCNDALVNYGHEVTGNYFIYGYNRSFNPLSVRCDMSTDGGGWIVIQRRGQFGNPIDYFDRTWIDYVNGFGDLDKEFWLGLWNIQNLLQLGEHELLIELQEVGGKKVYHKYQDFRLLTDSYKLKVTSSNNSNVRNDPLLNYNGVCFSTKDHDRDQSHDGNCGKKYRSGWWFSHCGKSNLNGLNYNQEKVNDSKGIVFSDENHDSTYSFAATEMKIRVTEKKTIK